MLMEGTPPVWLALGDILLLSLLMCKAQLDHCAVVYSVLYMLTERPIVQLCVFWVQSLPGIVEASCCSGSKRGWEASKAHLGRFFMSIYLMHDRAGVHDGQSLLNTCLQSVWLQRQSKARNAQGKQAFGTEATYLLFWAGS